MAVAIDAVENSGPVTDDTVTFPITVSGSDRAIVVLGSVNGSTAADVAFDGVSLSLAGADGADDMNAEAWAMAAPTVGTHDVVVTLNGTVESDWTAIALTGVDQGTPFGTTVTDHYTGTSTDHDHNTSNTDDGLVLDVFTISYAASSLAVESGQTAQAGPTADTNFNTGVSSKPGAATVTMGWTWTGDFLRWGHVTVPVNPVSVVPSDGTATSTSTVAGVGQSTATATGTSASTSTATGVGRSAALSTVTAASTSTATAVGSYAALAVGSAAGTSTATAVSGTLDPSVGTAASTSTVSAVGVSMALSPGSASSTSTATGVAVSVVLSAGAASALATATAVGLSEAVSIGTAAGTSTVRGRSNTFGQSDQYNPAIAGWLRRF